MEMTSYAQGAPSWVDIGVPDLPAAAAFYGGMFGWDAPEGAPEFGGYRICTLRGKRVAGLGPQTNMEMPPFWASYFNVSDAEAIAAKVTELGGQVVVPPMAIGDPGTMAFFADPVGAFFAVWQPNEHPGAELIYETGALGWNELITTDVEISASFYSALFGWDPKSQGPDGGYTEFQLDGRSIAGMMAKNEMMPAEMPPNWGVYFVVDDADASAATCTDLGGSVLMGPMDIEPGRIAVLADPFGAPFNVIKMNGAMS